MNQRQTNKYLKALAISYGCNPGETPRKALLEATTWCKAKRINRFCNRYVIEPDQECQKIKCRIKKIQGVTV